MVRDNLDSKTFPGMYHPAAFLRASGLAVRAAFLSLRSSPNGICIISLGDGRFINVNDTFLASTGYRLEEIIDKNVTEAAVVPIPDEKWGEVPKAFVVAKPGSEVTAEDIINYCKQHLARFKAPKAVEFGELPKTATGKVQKFKLKNKEWAGRERRVN